ncbi:hypothetical protein JH146_1619 [Methanocaldococcus bathoardescens]|uniref:KAP NTPase domain-containing protein n=1 Tax=Methanocaldococcus bathoardescens TaxID=1301915 RepID=A0A076LE07_9EURY|nr:P-loop NTPase fold protein [Methanocaldococcus bathoardescens]AIJ06461.1 hypothetical protein JH146_1619 [Methanocaldococcus bathoardescens]
MPLADKPIDLSENDYLGTKEKAEIIKDFIKHPDNRKYLRENNMIVLYGNWGSGKSSVIRYIHNELNKEKNFISIIFDAWLYEKDNNLPYSLLEFILDELKNSDKFKHKIKLITMKDELLKIGFDVFAGVLKGFSASFPLLGLQYNPKDVIEHFEKMNEIKSHYKEINELIDGFKKISKMLEDKTLVVFIDELDRCEPEHILDLLASIKLFFAYGENIIYFVAVDKEAVSKAIKTKYGDVIKAEEYLEKIFNISFSMPKYFELKEFVKQYDFFNDDEIAEKLEKFFKAINFTNPRHLKKVLNKYELLTRIKNLGLDKNNLIPEIIRIENGERKGYLFDTVFVLYFIILYEIYPEKYLEVKRYKYRVKNLRVSYAENNIIHKQSEFMYNILFSELQNPNIKNIMVETQFIEYVIIFEDIMKVLQNMNNSNNKEEFNKIVKIISVFLSCVGDDDIDENNANFVKRFAKAGITVDFWEYIKNYYKDLIENDYKNDYPFTNLFKMVETYL